MSPSFKAIWSDEALKEVENIIDYLLDNWGHTAPEIFLEKLRQREILLSHQPEAFPRSQKTKGYRRSVLTRQITVYYKLETGTVKI